ncbi:MAG TPA: DUF2182 domain-containing protein [Bacteroidota bacterium]|nr:DUF2182 domain-containing protein [Bacteroidota bacterium]
MERLLKQDRLIIGSALFLITAISWYYLVYLHGEMKGIDLMMSMKNCTMKMAMPMTGGWTGTDFLMMFLMWSIMMVAMMIPSAAPLLLLYASISRKNAQTDAPYAPTGFFLLGYILVWSGFSAVAAFLQWFFQAHALLSPMMISTSTKLGSGILLIAGVFQFTPFKNTCLTHCRSPLEFIMKHWKTGPAGALGMGVRHGTYCLGCCWMLMAVLFVTGIMNLLWVGVISLFVLLEKIAPKPLLISRIAGILLIGDAVLLLMRIGA